MPRPFMATIAYFNGRYWNHPDVMRKFFASNAATAGCKAFRFAYSNIVPKGIRGAEVSVKIKPIKEVKIRENGTVTA